MELGKVNDLFVGHECKIIDQCFKIDFFKSQAKNFLDYDKILCLAALFCTSSTNQEQS